MIIREDLKRLTVETSSARRFEEWLGTNCTVRRRLNRISRYSADADRPDDDKRQKKERDPFAGNEPKRGKNHSQLPHCLGRSSTLSPSTYMSGHFSFVFVCIYIFKSYEEKSLGAKAPQIMKRTCDGRTLPPPLFLDMYVYHKSCLFSHIVEPAGLEWPSSIRTRITTPCENHH